MFSFEGFFCSLDVLKEALGYVNCNFCKNKKKKKFGFIFANFSHQNAEMLDPGPNPVSQH